MENEIAQPVSRLLELPVELILCIADFLPLHSQLVLCSTNRALANILSSTCKRGLAQCQDKKDRITLHHEWYSVLKMNGMYLCPDCMARHTVVTWDTPGSWDRIMRLRPIFLRLSLINCGYEDLPHVSFNGPYYIHQRHVQLALRYWRHGDQPRRLEALLKPHKLRSIDGTFSVIPRIVDGSFLLYTHRQITGRRSGWPLSLRKVCPHLLDTQPGYQGDLGQPHYFSTKKGSCKVCLTDFALDYDYGSRSWYFESFHDFGSSGNPVDPCWTSQVERSHDDAAWVLRLEKDAGCVEKKFYMLETVDLAGEGSEEGSKETHVTTPSA